MVGAVPVGFWYPTPSIGGGSFPFLHDPILALDPGDINSYNPSVDAQTFTDLTGLTGDFFIGTDGTSEPTQDPLFVGTPGGLSDEYFHYNFAGGGSSGKINMKASPSTFLSSMHKDNASFSIMRAVWNEAATPNNSFQNSTVDTTPSITFSTSFDGSKISPFFSVRDDGGPPIVSEFSTLVTPLDTWTIVGLSIDEAAGADGSFFFVDGSTDTFDATYSTPSVANAGGPSGFIIGGASGDEGRQGVVLFWDKALTTTEMTDQFNAIKSRYGIA